jgi:hypothetical protein
MKTLSVEELDAVAGGINNDLLAVGLGVMFMGGLAVATGGFSLVAVGSIALGLGGWAAAAATGDLSGNGARRGSAEVNWNVAGDNFTICQTNTSCSGTIEGQGGESGGSGGLGLTVQLETFGPNLVDPNTYTGYLIFGKAG